MPKFRPRRRGLSFCPENGSGAMGRTRAARPQAESRLPEGKTAAAIAAILAGEFAAPRSSNPRKSMPRVAKITSRRRRVGAAAAAYGRVLSCGAAVGPKLPTGLRLAAGERDQGPRPLPLGSRQRGGGNRARRARYERLDDGSVPDHARLEKVRRLGGAGKTALDRPVW